MSFLTGLLRPEVEKHLLKTEQEFIVANVHKHWITQVPGVLLVVLGIVLFVAMPALGSVWPVALVAGLIGGLVGFWKIHVQNMDRFVVTNVRVFRVNGVMNQKMASVPLLRVLDITVDRPLLGQVLNFGHFVFETAAQDQGLKQVSYVPDIVNLDLLLQTVIQRAGVRARAGDVVEEYREFFDSLVDDGAGNPSLRARLASRFRGGRRVDPQDLDGV